MSPGQPLYATQFGRISLPWSTEIPPILFLLLLLPGRSSISHPARTPHLTALNLSLTPSNLSKLVVSPPYLWFEFFISFPVLDTQSGIDHRCVRKGRIQFWHFVLFCNYKWLRGGFFSFCKNPSFTPPERLEISFQGDLCWEHVGRVMNLFGTISCEAKACTHFVYYEKVE